MNVIEVTNLTKSYGSLKALDKFNLKVKKGEILGLLGPNGSGKSTSINSILSLLNYEEGEIKLFNQKMTPYNYEAKSKLGVVMQDVAVFNQLTVYENIDYFCGLYIKESNKRKEYVEDAINLVGLNDFKKFKPKKLSGGLLRRLNIACGIAHKPELIFLDEPTVAVDPQSRNNILEGIKFLNQQGATIVYTTHYMEEVEILCDRIVIIDHGKIIAEGTKEEIKNSIELGEKITLNINTNEDIKFDKYLRNIISIEKKNNDIILKYKKANDNLIKLINFLNKNNIEVTKLNSELPTLNDVFLEITGKELRDM